MILYIKNDDFAVRILILEQIFFFFFIIISRQPKLFAEMLLMSKRKYKERVYIDVKIILSQISTMFGNFLVYYH